MPQPLNLSRRIRLSRAREQAQTRYPHDECSVTATHQKKSFHGRFLVESALVRTLILGRGSTPPPSESIRRGAVTIHVVSFGHTPRTAAEWSRLVTPRGLVALAAHSSAKAMSTPSDARFPARRFPPPSVSADDARAPDDGERLPVKARRALKARYASTSRKSSCTARWRAI